MVQLARLHIAVWVADEHGRRPIEYALTKQVGDDPYRHPLVVRELLTMHLRDAISDVGVQSRALAVSTTNPQGEEI